MPANHPILGSKIGHRGKLKTRSGKIRRYTISDEIVQTQSNAPHKKICLQKINFDDGQIELRLAYYIIGKKQGMKGKWVFGQFATLLPQKDFALIVKSAIRKGWL